MFLLLILLAAFVLALLLQGLVTLLATWLVTGRRPALGAVIRAMVLAGITYVVALVVALFGWQWLQLALGLSPTLALLLVVGVALLASCWIFARCLDLNLLQAVAITLLVATVNLALGFAGQPWLPPEAAPGNWQKTLLTSLDVPPETVAVKSLA